MTATDEAKKSQQKTDAHSATARRFSKRKLCSRYCAVLRPFLFASRGVYFVTCVQLYIAKGMKHGDKVTFRGESDHLPGTLPGDIVVHLSMEQHEDFVRKECVSPPPRFSSQW